MLIIKYFFLKFETKTRMIQTSGFFRNPVPLPYSDGSGLAPLYESENGYCVLLKGHRNDRVVVYKALKTEFRDDPVHQRMLRREFEIGVSLKHPGICEVLGWVQIPGYGDSIEMEWIDGISLRSYLDTGPHPESELRRILSDICDALSYLHRKQVVHKDLKPENILITHQGNYPKLIDFGLSDTGSILTGKDPGGTWLYAAPEVIEGHAAEPRSDLYSLGCIMDEMGQAFAWIARKCKETDPAKRYPDAEEVRRALTVSRRPHWWYLWPILLLLLGLSVGLGFYLNREDPVKALWNDAVEQVHEAAKAS